MSKSSAPTGGWALYIAAVVWCAQRGSLTSAARANEQGLRPPTCQKAVQSPCSVSLLQASSRRFKDVQERADGLPDMRRHPDDIGHGGEALIKALGNWWHPSLPGMGAENGSAEQVDEDVQVQLPNTTSQVRALSKIFPPLKEPAHSADKNLVHDKQRASTEQMALKEPAHKADKNFVHDKQPATNESMVGREPQSLMNYTKVNRSMHSAVALMILGFFVFVLGMIYLIEFPHQDAQQAFWRLLSTAISVFVAVFIFTATQELIAYSLEDGRQHHGVEIGHRPPLNSTLVLLVFFRFLVVWILLQCFFLYTDSDVLLSAAMGKIGTHVMAFSAVDFFGTLQASQLFSQSLLHLFIGLIISSFFVWLWFALAESLRLAYGPEEEKMDVEVSPEEENAEVEEDPKRDEWFVECRSAECEAASLVLGLLVSQFIRFAISGRFAPLHGGSPGAVTQEQVVVLLLIGIALGVLLVPADIVVYELDLAKDSTRPVLDVLRGAWSMTMAWCLLYWSKWTFWLSTADNGWGYGDRMIALLAMALILSAISCACIFVIECIADTYARDQRAALVALNTAFGLVMGLSWETIFHAAVEGVGDLPYLSSSYVLNNILMIVALCAAVLPVWILHIFPRAMPCRRSGSKWVRKNEM
mmetsp:Transcript_68846/g.119508  ORF Transcript_68846/g.119508 Transcript_68846/m.119508 type:complete len:643 (+) Transcript_68846:82-2010(+)